MNLNRYGGHNSGKSEGQEEETEAVYRQSKMRTRNKKLEYMSCH